MKAVICLLAIIAGANAGFLFGGGGGWGPAPVPVTKVIKVIQPPVPIVQPVPVHIIKILHQPQPIIAPAPVVKILKVIEQPNYSGPGWGGWD